MYTRTAGSYWSVVLLEPQVAAGQSLEILLAPPLEWDEGRPWKISCCLALLHGLFKALQLGNTSSDPPPPI